MRILLFIVICYLAMHFSPMYAIPLVALYMFKWTSYELVLGAFLIDMYFGTATIVPEYTMVVLGMILALEWLRPRLVFNTQ